MEPQNFSRQVVDKLEKVMADMRRASRAVCRAKLVQKAPCIREKKAELRGTALQKFLLSLWRAPQSAHNLDEHPLRTLLCLRSLVFKRCSMWQCPKKIL